MYMQLHVCMCASVDRLTCVYLLHAHAYNAYSTSMHVYSRTQVSAHVCACMCMCVWCVLLSLAQCLKNSSEDKQSQKEWSQQWFFQLMEQRGFMPRPACGLLASQRDGG